jgi:hypothetical protein
VIRFEVRRIERGQKRIRYQKIVGRWFKKIQDDSHAELVSASKNS